MRDEGSVPRGYAPDPAERMIERERYRQRREQLAQLAPRERRFLAFQAIGLRWDDIAEREQVASKGGTRRVAPCRGLKFGTL